MVRVLVLDVPTLAQRELAAQSELVRDRVDRRAGIPRIDFTPVRVVRLSGAALTAGIDEHSIEGVPVRLTSPARTVVDCFKFRNRIGIDVAVEALRDYRRLRKGTVDELWRQADRLRMTRVMRPYWGCDCGVSGAAEDSQLRHRVWGPIARIGPPTGRLPTPCQR